MRRSPGPELVPPLELHRVVVPARPGVQACGSDGFRVDRLGHQPIGTQNGRVSGPRRLPKTGRNVLHLRVAIGYDTALPEGRLSFSFSKLSGTFEKGEMTIFASLQLTGDLVTINQVWQNGPLKGGTPAIHATSADHLTSFGTLNLVTGAAI
ncbi:hypothetical protein ACJRO7_001603 [Eucalyptus globulus]|uniref:AIR12 DOMON domain-containing protein n=1 Tax=Eucalyptus globulus TaxID=34317 RepID=A0ABD3M1F0_EUCGL